MAATKKKSAARTPRRRVANAALSLRHVISSIEEMEARYRKFRPQKHQRKDKDSALRLLDTLKKRVRLFCLQSGQAYEFVNIKNSLADPKR